MNIDPAEIPKGSDYQWAALSVCGDENLGDVKRLEKTGWRKVPKSRHPKLKSPDPKWVVNGGLVLMERPEFLTERAQQWERDKADAQLVSAVASMQENDSPWFSNGQSYFRTTRPVNWAASPIRRTTVKEWLVRNWWTLKVWFRNLFMKG